ncbi:MAG: hypothetical protein EBU46_00780 [Nitrosomonadaceae bacterium]|nr:hypothetical protein [Nitrosomonadaceae bacterium]
MKWKILFTLLLTLLLNICNAAVDTNYVSRVVDAIYWAEGGAKTKHPYGITTVKVKNATEARERCIFLVSSCFDRWDTNGRKGLFLEALQKTYCPTTGWLSYNERRLNGYWLKNVRFYIANPKPVL